MFTLFDRGRDLSRRNFLTVGSLGLGGLSLPMLLSAKAAGAEQHRGSTTGKSVIFLFQHGGPTQFETFDPKMSAPEGIRSVTGATPTSVPGVQFGGTMTKLARHAHRLAVVRSFQSGAGNHDIKPVVSPCSLSANIGSLYSKVVGTTRPTGMPTNAAIFPNAVDPKGSGSFDRFGKFASAGPLGESFAPFVPGAGGNLQSDMKLNLPTDRLSDRRSLRKQLDRLRSDSVSTGLFDRMDRFHAQAFEVILGGVASSFDLSKEDPRVIARYDTSHMVRPDSWKHKNNRKRYTANAKSLGKLLLLARRLCEAGCGFVTVSTDFVWDMHADGNNLNMTEGMDYVGNPFDHAVSAFIEDLEQRGLSDQILLVATGEMGRTYRVNKKGGRDHWGKLTPLMLYGGGITSGQVIGRSNRLGGEPGTTPITIRHLISTIMHTVLNPGEVRIDTDVPSDVAKVIADGTPIPGLFS